MSFFAQNATFSTGGDFEVADAGVYICRLKEVEPTKQPSFDDPNVQVDKFKWVFETNDNTDTKGNPFRFVKFTGTSYGNDKAALTILIDGMAGRRLTSDEFAALNLDNLKRANWRVMVDEGVSGKGNAINKILSVKPSKSGEPGGMVAVKPLPPAPKPPVEEDPLSSLEDPFATG